jgi:simple sugar transport system permease protein
MLSNYNIWLVPLVALFFACLNVGSIQLPMVLQLDSSLSGVIQGAMVHNIWLVPLVALFFACLNVGSIQLPMALQLDSSLSGVIQGAMVLAALGVHAWRRQWTEDR